MLADVVAGAVGAMVVVMVVVTPLVTLISCTLVLLVLWGCSPKIVSTKNAKSARPMMISIAFYK